MQVGGRNPKKVAFGLAQPAQLSSRQTFCNSRDPELRPNPFRPSLLSPSSWSISAVGAAVVRNMLQSSTELKVSGLSYGGFQQLRVALGVPVMRTPVWRGLCQGRLVMQTTISSIPFMTLVLL